MHLSPLTSAYCEKPMPAHLILGVNAKTELDIAAIGARLKELRLRSGDSQERVAQTIGCSVSDISRWERGAVAPQALRLARLAVHFGVSTDYLLFGPVAQPPAPESEAFRAFKGTRLGKIAAERGWLPALRAIKPPVGLEAAVYRDVVNRLLEQDERGGPAT